LSTRIIMVALVICCVPVKWSTADTIRVPADFPEIQEALDFAMNGDEVVVADGVYVGPGNKDLDFAGKAITLRSLNGARACIIDCQNQGRGFYFHNGEGPSAVVDGFTVRNGRVTLPGLNLGAGIACEGSSPTIRNCRIRNNFVGGNFGAGGGIFCRGSNATISNCAITGNQATGTFSNGGGVYVQSGGPTITDCVITGNMSGFTGGGVACTNGCTLHLVGCEVSSNTADFGGAIQCGSNSNPTIERCYIALNQAASTAGILCAASGAPTISDCAIVGNISPDQGGAIDCFAKSSPRITRCTISANDGNGVACLGGTPTIDHCVISGNSDDLAGCVATYSCIGDGDVGLGNIAGDPQFVSLLDFRLSSSSLCIDAGDPAAAVPEGTQDLDGHSRVLCGGLDIGAYESGIGDLDCDEAVDLTDFGNWKRCMTGPTGGPYPTDCVALDFDLDDHIGLRDFASLQNVFTGNP